MVPPVPIYLTCVHWQLVPLSGASEDLSSLSPSVDSDLGNKTMHVVQMQHSNNPFLAVSKCRIAVVPATEELKTFLFQKAVTVPNRFQLGQ